MPSLADRQEASTAFIFVGALYERPFFLDSKYRGSAKRKRESAQPQENRPPLQLFKDLAFAVVLFRA